MRAERYHASDRVLVDRVLLGAAPGKGAAGAGGVEHRPLALRGLGTGRGGVDHGKRDFVYLLRG